GREERWAGHGEPEGACSIPALTHEHLAGGRQVDTQDHPAPFGWRGRSVSSVFGVRGGGEAPLGTNPQAWECRVIGRVVDLADVGRDRGIGGAGKNPAHVRGGLAGKGRAGFGGRGGANVQRGLLSRTGKPEDAPADGQGGNQRNGTP